MKLFNEKQLEKDLEPYKNDLKNLIKKRFNIELPNIWYKSLSYISYLERFCYSNNLIKDSESIFKKYEHLVIPTIEIDINSYFNEGL